MFIGLDFRIFFVNLYLPKIDCLDMSAVNTSSLVLGPIRQGYYEVVMIHCINYDALLKTITPILAEHRSNECHQEEVLVKIEADSFLFRFLPYNSLKSSFLFWKLNNGVLMKEIQIPSSDINFTRRDRSSFSGSPFSCS